jgi:fibronectin-binding autotransporter adhesin
MKPRRVFFAARLSLSLATALIAVFVASHAQAQTTILWNTTPVNNVSNGAWGTAVNWVGSNIPDTNAEIASLSRDWTGTGPTFALGADRTVNGVIYNDTGATGDQVGTIVAGSTLTLAGSTTPTITTTNSFNINSIVSWGAAGLTKAGGVTLTLSGNNTGTGPVTVSAGVLRATTSANALGTGAATLSMAASTTLQLTNDTGLSFSRNTTISGTDSTITADRLTSAATSTTHTLGTLSIGAHTLNITRGSSITGAGIGGITFGTTTLSAGPAVFITGADSNVTLGAVGGAFALTKQGAGQMTLGTTSTRTTAAGITNLSAGILRLNTANALNTLATAPLNISGGTLSLAVTAGATYGGTATTVSGSSTVEADAQASTATVTQTLGTLSIGAQTLSIARGANVTGTGGITFGNATQTGSATFSPAADAAVTLGGTTALGTFTLNKTGAGSMTMTGIVSGGPTTAGNDALNVTVGTLTLSAAGNTFSGDVVINGATAVVSMAGGTFTAANPLGTQASVYKSVELSNGGTFRLSTGNYNINVPAAGSLGAGQVFNIGTGGGVFDVASGSTFSLDDGTGAAGTAWTAPQLRGGGALTKSGTGTLALGAGSSNFGTAFTGTITVNAGLLQVGNAGNPLGNTTSGTTIASGAALNVNGTTQTVAEPLTITGAGLASNAQGALTNASATAATWAGPVTLGGAATIGSSAAGGITLNAAATVNTAGNILTLRNSSTGRIFTDGVISGAGSVVMNSPSSGDYVPRADHTYSGGTTLTAGLTAVDRDSIGTPGSPTSGPFGTATLTLGGGQIRSGSGASRTVGNAVTISADTTFYTVPSEKTLTFSGPVTLSGGSRILTSNIGSTVATTAAVFNGAIGDGGNVLGLTINGNGNFVLAGANTYTGATVVNSGRSLLSGSLNPASALSVSPTVAGGTTFTLANGTANPVSSTAALTLGSSTGPTTLGFDIGANGAASDSINTTAAATTTGTVNISVQAIAGFGSSSSYDLISAPSGLGGATYVLTSAPGGYSCSLTTSGTLVTLNVTPATSGDRFWRGDVGTSWGAFNGLNSNWYTDAAGSTNAQANPAAGETVTFSTINATNTAGVINTTLDNDFTVNDLIFGNNPNGVTSVTIAGGTTPAGNPGVLSISPTLSNEGIVVGANAGNVTISSPVLLGADQTWTVDGTGANGSTLNVSGPLSGSGDLDVSGLVTLSAPGNSTFNGDTTVPSGAVLRGGATNSFSVNSALTVSGTGLVQLNGFSNTVAAFYGDGTVQNNHASTGATLTVGDAANTSFTGVLQNGAGGTLGLTKNGAGSLTLSGANTHTGATTVNAGTLIFGTATTLTATNPVTLGGTGILDINGFSVNVGAISSAVATSAIINSSTSTAPSTATALYTPSGAGVYVDALSSASSGNIAALINDGPVRKIQVVINNANGSAQLTNDSNTFSGGLVLLDNPSGTRLNISSAIAGTRFGTGALVIGQASTDRAGVFFSAIDNTLSLPIIVNTSIGTDRFGIRNDGRTITLSGLITANADLVFSSNLATASNTIITNKVTGSGGLAVDLSQTSTSNTISTVTLNTAANANDYTGNTEIGRTNVAPAQNYTAALALGAADQIPDGTGKGNVIITNNSGTRTGTLRLAGFSETINGLSGNGNVDGGSGTPTLTLGGNNAPGNFSGNILNGSGTLTVTKIGSGTQILSGASTFAGPLNVNGGLVAFATSPATAGPLGNSTVVNLNGGGISFTAAGANNLNRPVAIGASAGTVDVANATGALTIAATSTGGDLVKTGSGAALIPGTTQLNVASNGAGVVVNDGSLQAGFGGSDVATVSVGATGNLDLRDSATEALVLENSTGALSLAGGAQVGFELNGANNDSIAVTAGGTATASGTVTLNFFGTPAAGTYNLLAADSGLSTATYALGTAPNGFNYTINVTDSLVSVTVSAFTPTYWRGGQDFSWNTLGAATANWTTDAGGTTDASSTPSSADTVLFSATGAPFSSGTVIDTTLDAAFTVDSLQFTNVPAGVTAVSIAAGSGGALTLNPLSTSGGIRVLAGGGNAAISAPLTVGAAQTWDIDSSGSLTLSGNTAFNGNVTKSNTGALTLSGTNSGSGAFTLAGGTLNLNSSNGLGTGLLTIGAGTTLNATSGAIALATNNAQTWNGDFIFTGANSLSLGTGAVTLGASLAINTPGAALTVGGTISDGGNNRGISKTGVGTLVLNGANSYTGPTTITGGVLRITQATGLGTSAGGVTQSGTSALELDGTGGAFSVGAEPLTINGGGITNLGALRNIAGDNTYGGTVTMAAQSRINSDSGTLTLSNPTSVSATNLTLVVGGAGNLTISGAVATGTGGVSKADGAGTLTLQGTNTYTGGTNVSAGTLTLASTGSITTASNILLTVGGATSVANIAGTYTSTGGGGVAINSGGILNTSGTVSLTGANNQAILMGTSGGSGTWNVTGGSVTVGYTSNGWGIGNGGLGTLNVSGGSVTTGGGNTFNVGHAASSTGVLTVSGTGLVTISPGSASFRVGHVAASTGTVNLDGGTLALGRAVTKDAASTAIFNFNGGLLRAGLSSATYMTGLTRANVRDGGALINTNGFNVTVGQALLHSDNVLDNAIDGGLTKSGLGILTLTGANGYTGATLVSAGTLQLNGSAATGTLTTSSMTVGAGGTLGFTAGSASTLDLSGKDMTLAGGTLAFDIGDAGVNDAITVNNFTLSANSALSLTGIGAIGGSYTLLTSTNPITNAGPYTITGQTIGRVTLTPTVNSNTITIDSTVFEGKWNQLGGGNWSLGNPSMTQDNWDNYKPTIAGDAALFGDSITAPSTVVVDTPHIAGYLRFDNTNAYTIGTNGSSNLTLNNGSSNAVATVTTGSHTIAENVALLSHLDVIPASGTTLTLSGVLSGSTRNLELNGPGSLVLSGANTYSGSTTVSNGSLTLSGARTATMGAITVGNLASTTGTLNISNGTLTTGTFAVGSGTNALTAGIVNHTGGNLTMSGSQLLLGNGGTGVLPGSNSTGTYNLNGGTLNTVAGGTGVLIGTNTGTTGVFNMMTGTLNMAATSTMQIARSDNNAASATTGSFIQTGGTATVGILQMSGTTLGAANNAGGSSTLNLTGGTFTAATFNALSGANQSSSAITIGGTAQVTLPVFPTNVKGTSSTATITFDSTTGFLSPAATSTTYIPAGTFTNAYLTANGADLNIPTGRDITIAQVLEDAPTFAGTLTKSGVGILTLSSANTYTGLTTVSEGTISVNHVDTLGTTAAGTSVASGGRVIFGNLATNATVAEPFAIAGTGTTANNGALNMGSSKTVNLTGAITLTGDALVTADGGSALNFTGAGGITGTDTDFSFTTDGSVASSITGSISLGTGTLTKSGSSTLILSGDNTYSGGTIVAGGILAIPSTGDAGTGAISLTSGVRLEFGAVTLANAINIGSNGGVVGRGQIEGTNGITTLSGPLAITSAPGSGGTFATTGAGTLLNLNGAITATPATLPVSVRVGNVNFGGGGNYTDLRISGNIGINSDNGISTSAVLTVGASVACVIDLKGFNQSLAGMIRGGSAGSVINSTAATSSTLTLTNSANSSNSVVLAGTGAGTLSVTQAGSAVQTLSGVNTYTGPTTVTSGTLAAGVASVANVSGAFGRNSAVIMADNATAVLDITGFNTQIGSLTGGGATGGNVNLGAATLSVGGDNTSPVAYAGAIAGTGALTKIGTGTQTLSGANTYTGNTTVSAGTLALVGGSHASAITVSSGASLSFTLGSPTSSTNSFNLSAGTIKITGTPTLPSYTLISSSTGITGTPVLDAPIAGYALRKVGNTLVLENPYEVWAAANGVTGGKTGDPDNDGLKNLLEYAFGTDPAVSSVGPLSYSGGSISPGQPILEEDGGIWYAVFCRRADYLDAGLIYTAMFSYALSDWTATGVAPTVIATDSVIDVVRVPFLNFVPSDSGPQKPTFFQVEVSQ